MRIAVPMVDGRLSSHFGHCEEFALIDIIDETSAIHSTQIVASPPHEPGLLPRWLAEKGARVIIAAGMGGRAQALFEAQNIAVVVGVPTDTPETIAMAYANGSLETGNNECDH